MDEIDEGRRESERDKKHVLSARILWRGAVPQQKPHRQYKERERCELPDDQRR